MIFEFQATGTTWKIECDSSDYIEEVKAKIDSFEKTYSRFLDSSFTAKISNTVGEFTLPADAKPMLDLYFDLNKITDGLFTPLIGQALIEAGYDKNYSLVPKKLSAIPLLNNTIEYDYPKLKVNKPVQFDFGGIGKGYLIDLISDFLKEKGLKYFVINAGGDIFVYGAKSINVGLEHPGDSTKIIGYVNVANKSVCASSGNRRKWNNFHHIINPKELKSPENIIGTWVIADTAIVADSIATCLFLVSPEKLNRYYKYDYLILHSDFSISKSKEFGAELYA